MTVLIGGENFAGYTVWACKISLQRKNIRTIANYEAEENRKRPPVERFVDAVSRRAGSVLCVYLHIIWFSFWLTINSFPLIPEAWRFDPFPFSFLTFVVSLEAIFLSLFILISQNYQSGVAEPRNLLDVQINLLAEKETSEILRMLEALHTHLGIVYPDPELPALEKDTDINRVIAQIEGVLRTP